MLFNPIYENKRTGMAVYAPVKNLKRDNPFYTKLKELPSTGKKENPFYKRSIHD